MKLFRKKKSKPFPPCVTAHAIINGIHREVTVQTVGLLPELVRPALHHRPG